MKEYVLDRRCQIGDIVTYLSQVASALHYLHVNHIVHGDLSAEYVNVVTPDKVHEMTLHWHDIENNHYLGCPQNTCINSAKSDIQVMKNKEVIDHNRLRSTLARY